MKTVINAINGIEKVNEEQYYKDAENGFMTFFDFIEFRFGEGSHYTKETPEGEVLEDTITYYIFDFGQDETVHYRISETHMMEFLKINYCYNPEVRSELIFEKLVELNILQLEKE